jgi:hypothetical protein
MFWFKNPFYEVRKEIWLTNKEDTLIELSHDKESILFIDHALGKSVNSRGRCGGINV